MSKAFTREDDQTEGPALPTPVSSLPRGARNLLTPEGAARLRAELARLGGAERTRLLAAALFDTEAKRELALVNQRMRHLQHSLLTAEIVAVDATPADRVRFGSTVTVRDARGAESIYRIVGVDEADISRHEVSWVSPIARALTNGRPGQRVACTFPSGPVELEIVRVE